MIEHKFSSVVIDTMPQIHSCVCGFKGSEETVAMHIASINAANAGLMLELLDSISASLGLPLHTDPEDIAKAARICAKRCQELEQKLLAFQESHVHRTPIDELQELRDRIAALESKR